MSLSSKGPVLLTGASGFVGQHLQRALENEGFQVHALQCQLSETSALEAEVASSPWSSVIHLAGLSSPPACEAQPHEAFATNLLGAIQVARALHRAHGHTSPLIFASSAHVYSLNELGPQASPIGESFHTAPTSVYGQSKLFAELALQNLSDSLGLNTLILRFFNHTHRSQSANFFLPRVHHLLSSATISAVRLPLGNVDVWRDLGTVQDLCAGLVHVVKSRERIQGCQKLNFCSGQSRSLRSLVHELALQLGKSVEIETDPRFLRSQEPERIAGSMAAFAQFFDWQPPQRSDSDFIQCFLEEI